MADVDQLPDVLPQYDRRAALCMTAIINEFPAFDRPELASYCQQALLQSYNPVTRPWECLPIRGDNGIVTLWPNHFTVITDGAAVLESLGIQWKWIDKGSIVAPSDEEREKFKMLQGDVLYRAAIEHNTGQRQWQKAVGRLVKDGWPMDAAFIQAGNKPGWEKAEGFSVIRAGEEILGEANGRNRNEVGFLRAQRQVWLGLVAPSDMTAVRRKRQGDVMAEVDTDLEAMIDTSPRTNATLRQSESNLASERPFA